MGMIDRALKVTVASGKGGTGKTFFSTNFALALSEKYRVVLADLDVEEPNDSIFFDNKCVVTIPQYKSVPRVIEESCINCGLCSRVCNFGAIISIPNKIVVFDNLCHSCYACSELCPSGAIKMENYYIGDINKNRVSETLLLVEGRIDTKEEQSVPMIEGVKNFVNLIKREENYDLAIFDSPPGTSCPMISAVKDSDYIIFITEPTEFGLNDLRLAIETAILLKKSFGVVINRYEKSDNCVERYCNETGVDIIAKVPYDKEIAYNYSNGNLCNSYFKEDMLQNIINRVNRNDKA